MAQTGILERLPDAIARAESLPSPPTVAVEVLRLTRDENADVAELTRVLSLDPALSARILKLANSTAFRRGEAVSSLDKATMRLGLKTVKLMALSFSLTGGLSRKPDDTDFDYSAFWHRSVTMAVAGRALAQRVECRFADEAFLCGLLARFGQIVIAECLPDRYAPLIVQAEGGLPSASLEREHLGYDFHEVGAALLAAWELPELITTTIRYWHEPAALPPGSDRSVGELARLVHLADVMAAVLCEPERGGCALSKLHDAATEEVGLSEEEIDAFVVGLEEDVSEMAGTLNVDVGAESYQDIVDRARAQLVQISLGTAIDLQQTSHRAVELERENLALASQANTDKLTGIPNRAHFDHALEQLVADGAAGRSEPGLGILMIDVDHFKRFNDDHGHAVGDLVLQRVAEALQAATRETDVVARYGGEEFVVIVSEAASDVVEYVAERIRRRIEDCAVEHDGRTLSVTASVGGSWIRTLRSAADATRLLEAADACLYEAKRAGRNRSVCRTPGD